ncbi:MAG: hypothetical protein GWO20_19970 [Candidatus Korarchaeota archaeon]|nr:hypothetical protein [Candidatus Korarchaeota archaeon]NIU85509.1 hypothetical protein [Candidatus Thorarchaeota archaeon]NIW15626.1 hypothetical protein [Candidatus Thorarchaeota archaeon]NIW53557.1 hypothetical protein [Candidatus Korarchaeota archaeon]
MEKLPERVQKLVRHTRELIKKIDKVSESLSKAMETRDFQLVKTQNFENFSASIFKKEDEKKLVLRIEPKIDIKRGLFTLLYRSELVPERLKEAVTTEGMTVGSNIFQITVDAPEPLLDYALDQIIIKLRKAFWSFSKPETRQTLLKLKKNLDNIEGKEEESQREMEILEEKINDLLFYTVQLP